MRVKPWVILSAVMAAALIVRVYKLNELPYGLHVDEVKAGWNAVSIWETGHDDKGNSLPFYYDSFGDYRPAGIIYLIVPFIAFLGRTVWSIRLPAAIIGALTVIPMYLFVNELAVKKGKRLGVIASMLLAFNPWHIILSRSTSEGVVALFLALWGMYFLLKTLKSPNWKYTFGSTVAFLVSYFFYHNIRVLAPMFVLAAVILGTKLLQARSGLRHGLVVLGIVSAATFLLLMSSAGRGRMNQVSIKSDFRVLYEVTKMPNEEGPNNVFTARAFHNRAVSYIRIFADEYKNYFSTNFLLGGIEKPVRYTVPQTGIITYIEAILIMFGLFQFGRKKELAIVGVLLLLAPIPAAITNEDSPNLMRSLFMIPFLIIIAAYGIKAVADYNQKNALMTRFVAFMWFVNFVYFGHMYLNHQNQSIATYFRDGGNFEAALEVLKLYKNNKEIVLSNSPDNFYPWVAFESSMDTTTVNNALKAASNGVTRLENIVFSSEKCPSLKAMETGDVDEEVLFVDGEGCMPDVEMKLKYDVVDKLVIKRPDNSPPYIFRSVSFKNQH